MLDHFAEWAWVVGDYCRPMSERVWAGAKGVGTAAFLAFGGELGGKALGWAGGKVYGRVAQALYPAKGGAIVLGRFPDGGAAELVALAERYGGRVL